MKVKFISDSAIPGSFSIVAESPEEMFILRSFCADRHRVIIDSYGGNIKSGEFSMLIRKDLDETHHG